MAERAYLVICDTPPTEPGTFTSINLPFLGDEWHELWDFSQQRDDGRGTVSVNATRHGNLYTFEDNRPAIAQCEARTLKWVMPFNTPMPVTTFFTNQNGKLVSGLVYMEINTTGYPPDSPPSRPASPVSDPPPLDLDRASKPDLKRSAANFDSSEDREPQRRRK